MWQRFLLLSFLLPSLLFADTWKTLTTEDKLPANEVQFLRVDAQGHLWIGTLGGLAQYSDGKLKTVLDKGQAWCIYPNADGSIWVGSNSGALLLRQGKKQQYLAGQTVAPIVRFDERSLWALIKDTRTEQNALVAFTEGKWGPVGGRYDKLRVADLFQDSKGNVWVVEEANGVWEVNRAKFGTPNHHLEGRNVSTVYEDKKGRIWCGLAGGGVMVHEDGAWTRHLDKEKSTIYAIQDDGKGNIHVATSANGLWRFDGKSWTNDLAAEGAVNLLYADSKGRVWISTQNRGGLRYWDGKAWVVSMDSPLPIRCMAEVKGKLFAGGVLDGLHILQ